MSRTRQYRTIHHSKLELIVARVIALILVALDLWLIYWLVFRSRYPGINGWLWHSSLHAASTDGYILLRAGMALGLDHPAGARAGERADPVAGPAWLRVIRCRWSLIPGCGWRSLTTIVPDREPVELAERTLRAAKHDRLCGGQLDPVAAG